MLQQYAISGKSFLPNSLVFMLSKNIQLFLTKKMDDINTSYCQPANLIPHFWNYKIVDKDNRPDLPCIILLSEVFGWFRNLPESKTYYSTGKSLPELVEGRLAISYDYLADKLNFQKERIRKNFIKLEHLKILSRYVKNIALEDGSRINQLYISIDKSFFKDCFRDPEFDIRVRSTELASIDDSENIINSNQSPHYTQTQSSVFEESHCPGGEHIRKKKKTRSVKSVRASEPLPDFIEYKNLSNFFENDLNNSVQGQENREEQESTIVNNSQNSLQRRKQRQLEDFYPLSEEDCSTLQSSSGREFSLNAMNEILKNMSKRLSDRSFYGKKGFLSYMSQVFRYEKRQATAINNTDFRIRSNLDASEQTLQIQEKYLTELEYSLQVSPEWHLKKKLASVLERSKAYNLLTSYKNLEIEQGGKCRLILNKHVDLTANDKDIILNQIKATHERVKDTNNFSLIDSLAIEVPVQLSRVQKNKAIDKEIDSQSKNNENNNSIAPSGLKPLNSSQSGIWGKVRRLVAKSLGGHGEAIDNHWLSKLDANIDQKNNSIVLKASSDYVRSYIEERLWVSISKIANQTGFELLWREC